MSLSTGFVQKAGSGEKPTEAILQVVSIREVPGNDTIRTPKRLY